MIRVVADTNIYISALMFGGLPGSFLDLASLLIFTLVISPALLDELDEKLRLKFKVAVEDAKVVREKLMGIAQVAEPDFILGVVRDDPDDNRVLEWAVERRANYIVSGDRHLLRLKEYAGIPILTVRQFLDVIARQENP